jgi:hypothetical protein
MRWPLRSIVAVTSSAILWAIEKRQIKMFCEIGAWGFYSLRRASDRECLCIEDSECIP